MSIRSWWNDDRHFIPRVLKDLVYGRVGLYTIEYDEVQDVYIQRLVRMTPKDIWAVYPDAVHVTGKKDYCHMDPSMGTPQWIRKGECGAIELYHYNRNESINNALLYHESKNWVIDWKMLGIAAVAIVAVILVYASGIVSI